MPCLPQKGLVTPQVDEVRKYISPPSSSLFVGLCESEISLSKAIMDSW